MLKNLISEDTMKDTKQMSLPLSGVKVLDLSNVIAGPLCTFMFGLLGAEVIKVERPGTGDLARKMGADADRGRKLMGTSFLALNANKKSVTLNIQSAEGQKIFKDLVAGADVVFENFRPGTMEKLGLGYPVLKEINPALVYCAVSGFGQEGPLARRPAYDQIIQSMSGLMSLTGTPESGPVRAGFVVSDSVGAVTAAFATVSALYRSKLTGEGAMVDVSMLDSSLMMAAWIISNFLNSGRNPFPMGNENHSAAPSGTYPAKDGPVTIVCNEEKQFHTLCDVIGRPDLKTDPVWSDRYERIRRRSELIEILLPYFAEKTGEEWEEILNARDVPAARVYSVPDILAHPQMQGRGFVRKVVLPDEGGASIDLATLGFRFVGEDDAPLSPPPRLGADNDSVYGALGLDGDEIDRLRRAGVV